MTHARSDAAAPSRHHAIHQALVSAERPCLPQAQKSDLILQLDWARNRLDTLEQLGRWAIDLRARLWRQQQIFLYADVDADFGSLADEVAQFRRVSKAVAWPKGGV
jgi:hypothetical protein